MFVYVNVLTIVLMRFAYILYIIFVYMYLQRFLNSLCKYANDFNELLKYCLMKICISNKHSSCIICVFVLPESK